MADVNKVPRLEIRLVENPEIEPVPKQVEDIGRDDQFELTVTDGNGGSVTYSAPRDEMRNTFIKMLRRLERVKKPSENP